MKEFIVTKKVKATPAKLKGGKIYLPTDAIPRTMEPVVDGYKVIEENGHEYFVPKAEFEQEYKCTESFLDRLIIEDEDLKDKYEKCSAFVESEKFREIIKDAYPAFLLYLQREAMGSYLGTLHNRIEYANGAKTKCNTQYDSGESKAALKFGLPIRRKSWREGLCVIKQVPAHISSEIIPKMQSLPETAKNLILKGTGFIKYEDQCLLYDINTGRADSWSPSISDVFAEDWEILFPEE